MTRRRNFWPSPRTTIAVALLAIIACRGSDVEAPGDRVEAEAIDDGPTDLDVLTFAYDAARTGVQPNETVLTPDTLRSGKFGKRQLDPCHILM